MRKFVIPLARTVVLFGIGWILTNVVVFLIALAVFVHFGIGWEVDFPDLKGDSL